MSNHISYKRPDPYPVPDGLRPNSYFARILLENYAGKGSELTAITQYIYHHLEAEQEDLADCLRGIAIVEMHHLDLLGSCIRQLGVSPRYRTIQRGRPFYWSSRAVTYGSDIRKMLELDLKGERQAIAHYRESMEKIREPQICNLLQRIIEDEELHIQVLEQFLEQR